jgi:hypothetical protein
MRHSGPRSPVGGWSCMSRHSLPPFSRPSDFCPARIEAILDPIRPGRVDRSSLGFRIHGKAACRIRSSSSGPISRCQRESLSCKWRKRALTRLAAARSANPECSVTRCKTCPQAKSWVNQARCCSIEPNGKTPAEQTKRDGSATDSGVDLAWRAAPAARF